MAHITWPEELNTGINVIDEQHKRIVTYINDLDDAKSAGDTKKVGDVIDELVDYTVSHFAFEESLMEQANYPFLSPHKKVHELFVRRVGKFVERYKDGEDITDELHTMLSKWLINHIRNEDADYANAVGGNMDNLQGDNEGWLSRSIKKFFG
jgi:hemerythrin